MKQRALLLSRLLLGCTFLVAGALKVGFTSDPAQSMMNYKILPEISLGLFAAILPWAESIPALTLLCGFWMQSSALILGSLSLVFAGAVASVIWRHIDVTCGCFRGEIRSSYGHLVFNLVLVALAVVIVRVGPRSKISETGDGAAAKSEPTTV